LKYEEIPAAVRQRVKDCIIDTVAVILYGGKLPWSQMVIAHAHRSGAGGKSHILGHRRPDGVCAVGGPCPWAR
jgi:2-methylcitrate dehydratase PrpD